LKPDRDKDSPLVLIVAAKWWALSARMAAALHRHGCRVSAICPAGHPLTLVSGMRRIYHYGGVFSLTSLRRAIEDCRPDVIIPCDDGVVAQLHALHELDSSLRPLIEHSLGSPDSFGIVQNRFRFLDMARELGIRVPKTRRIEGGEDLAAWHAEVSSTAVLKVDGESGGNGVRIVHSLDESRAATEELRRPCGPATAWKRLAIDGDPLALWLRHWHRRREVTAQEFIVGRPANSMLACWRGELLSLVSVLVVAAEGPTGAATIVRVIHDESMAKAAQRVSNRLQLTGFYGLDFIMESASGLPYLIEMNPRCTQLGHQEFAGVGSLAGAFSAVLRGEPRPPPRYPIGSDLIALFPQALAAGEACRRYIEASYHDVPSDEPALAAELLKKVRPHRQWTARLYHAVNPRNRAQPAVFEELSAKAVFAR